MADKLDVAGRLAEARPAVENTQCYVWACHLLGYQNPDLTTHSAQIRDWSSGEDGMDLHVLDADCEAISAAAAAADDALARQRDQLTRLAAAWQGGAGTSAQDFVRRHCDAAGNVTASVRAAADALAGLRDALWQEVDAKAAALTGIDDRRQGERSAWVAAAQTVNTGVGDRAAASELVDQQVKPYVDNDIRVDWLTAVRTAMSSIGNSYDTAAGEIAAGPPAQFDVPGDFGTDPVPTDDDDGPPTRDPAPSTAAAGTPPYSPPAAAPYPSPAAPSYPTAPAPYSTAAAPLPAAMGANPLAAAPVPSTDGLSSPLGGAPSLPASLGQLDGLSQRFADALSGLTTATEDPVPDPPEPPAAVDDAPARDDEPAPEEDAESTDDETDCGAGEHARAEKPAPSAGVEDPAAEPAPVPPPAPAPPPPDPPPPEQAPAPGAPAAPVDEFATPCEIAADELPQAGQ